MRNASPLGAHVQHYTGQVQTWLRLAKPRIVKWLEFPPDMLAEVHGWGGINLARVDLGVGALDVDAMVGAILAAHAKLGDLIDYWELWNEPPPNGDALSALNDATIRAISKLTDLKILVGCIPEGNPADLGDWPRFYPAMRAALAAGGGLALHE